MCKCDVKKTVHVRYKTINWNLLMNWLQLPDRHSMSLLAHTHTHAHARTPRCEGYMIHGFLYRRLVLKSLETWINLERCTRSLPRSVDRCQLHELACLLCALFIALVLYEFVSRKFHISRYILLYIKYISWAVKIRSYYLHVIFSI